MSGPPSWNWPANKMGGPPNSIRYGTLNSIHWTFATISVFDKFIATISVESLETKVVSNEVCPKESGYTKSDGTWAFKAFHPKWILSTYRQKAAQLQIQFRKWSSLLAIGYQFYQNFSATQTENKHIWIGLVHIFENTPPFKIQFQTVLFLCSFEVSFIKRI